ncbi:hypothetical protein [Acinetobacter baumannii]|uniref:hypothetical protein n=1 Tax=Acinetobacter baumannii TaxID=470 RepID=UPI0021C19C69|nr:hypothetical protein [Acinetobacter baumannii]MCT9373766.1 hypothetical protein [Acinetobacter baumannii]MDN8143014.1 hypothetical protein [Acinetobacter baumannii]MDV4212809.1 hypothetical protein [Acinetobacter baumannii]HCQ9572015.1 hypothetical protein [Acinetobacter baumannii]
MDKPMTFDEVFKEAYDHWIDDANIHRYEGAKGLADQVWQHQQAKVEELQKRVDAATRKWIAVTSIATTCPNQLPDEFFQKLDELHDALCGYELEQALKGEG